MVSRNNTESSSWIQFPLGGYPGSCILRLVNAIISNRHVAGQTEHKEIQEQEAKCSPWCSNSERSIRGRQNISGKN